MKEVPLEPDDEAEQLEEQEPPGDEAADYVEDFSVFVTKIKGGTFSALSVSFENSSQILELSAPSCSITPLLVDYGLEASNPFDINMVSNVNKLAERLRSMRPTIVLYKLLGVDKKNMKNVLCNISNELHEYIKDTGFILVVLDSMTSPVMTRKIKHKLKELKNVEEHIFHPGGNSNHYCSMMTNMPSSYASYPLSQTSDRTKNRLAVFAVKLRESFKVYLSDKDDWPTSYYPEALLDTLLEDLSPTEVKDLDVWYGRHDVQEQVCKITTDDKFLQNMMRSVDALPARTEANLESINGRTAEFFKTSVFMRADRQLRNRGGRRRTTMIWLWIHSIRCSQLILQYYPFLIKNLLLHWILRLADRVVEHTAKPQRLQPLPIQNLVMIRHVRLDKRNLLFQHQLYIHLILRRVVLP